MLRGVHGPRGGGASGGYSRPSLPPVRHTVASLLSAPESTSAEPLCPTLIVPEECECLIAIPIRPLTKPAHGPLTVMDMSGRPVVRIRVQQGEVPASLGHHSRPGAAATTASVLLLESLEGERFAECRATPLQEFAVCRPSGERYATLSPSAARNKFRLLLRDGGEVTFSGHLQEHTINVVDSEKRCLAMTEKCTVDFESSGGQYYSARLAPGSDVGMLVCGLLCIQILAGLA